MDGWGWAWVAWIGGFVMLEVPALLTRQPGATLSEHVWAWFHVNDSRHTVTTWVLRSVLLVFLAWLLLHLGFGLFG